MSDQTTPERQTESARAADSEMVRVLSEMIADNETITVRAVVRHMSTLAHASALTRDAWRSARIAEWQAEQQRLRSLAERSDKSSKTNLAASLEIEKAKLAQLEAERNLALGGLLAAIHAVGELGGMKAWLRFFEHSAPALDRLRTMGALPSAELVQLKPMITGSSKPGGRR